MQPLTTQSLSYFNFVSDDVLHDYIWISIQDTMNYIMYMQSVIPDTLWSNVIPLKLDGKITEIVPRIQEYKKIMDLREINRVGINVRKIDVHTLTINDDIEESFDKFSNEMLLKCKRNKRIIFDTYIIKLDSLINANSVNTLVLKIKHNTVILKDFITKCINLFICIGKLKYDYYYFEIEILTKDIYY
jgi:hypothetical protein